MATQPLVDPELLQRKTSWQPYFAAKLGFRDHWYVACFSHELGEGAVVLRQIMGEGILLRRIDGAVYAIRDRCIHRGVRLSEKVECHTADTISCWYHGFTFRWATGDLCAVFGAPESTAIGKKKIETYPVSEAKGLVFVYIGEQGATPPPLAHDCPPNFLDDDNVVEGEARMVASNWRLGPEGGLDEIHRYLHRESPLLLNIQGSMPLGHTAMRGQFELIDGEDGPRGIIDRFKAEKMFFDAEIDGVTVAKGVNFGAAKRRAVYSSCWMPACLKVEGFPDDGVTLFEWYVPVDETTHRCFITFGKHCADAAGEAAFRREYHTRWLPLAIDGFLSQDIMARESSQHYYQNDRAWFEEGLIGEDFMLIEWRKLCSRRQRTVQSLDRLL
ncbi:Rieske 2Fe-2S domain-containing protein [Novosphingobium lentum]|uniref:Rieske 2Fe-2S domain-containing protein n=1 Tax=Novosphingobium lentum TaxID=145287 RepID=UPI00082AE431|nr:Rieske 2Fe-2S domain-containing protein [Novosphingobium lentum]